MSMIPGKSLLILAMPEAMKKIEYVNGAGLNYLTDVFYTDGNNWKTYPSIYPLLPYPRAKTDRVAYQTPVKGSLSIREEQLFPQEGNFLVASTCVGLLFRDTILDQKGRNAHMPSNKVVPTSKNSADVLGTEATDPVGPSNDSEHASTPKPPQPVAATYIRHKKGESVVSGNLAIASTATLGFPAYWRLSVLYACISRNKKLHIQPVVCNCQT